MLNLSLYVYFIMLSISEVMLVLFFMVVFYNNYLKKNKMFRLYWKSFGIIVSFLDFFFFIIMF